MKQVPDGRYCRGTLCNKLSLKHFACLVRIGTGQAIVMSNRVKGWDDYVAVFPQRRAGDVSTLDLFGHSPGGKS